MYTSGENNKDSRSEFFRVAHLGDSLGVGHAIINNIHSTINILTC